jgi:AraC family transcriptional regulator of adaptative response / DNA-3-methyladenine glycosylase II
VTNEPLRLAFAPPYDRATVLEYLRRRAIPGVESAHASEGGAGTYQRVVRLAHGAVVVELAAFTETAAEFAAGALDERDRAELAAKLRALFDCDADPQAIDATLACDPLLAASVRRRPGLRVPGAVDGFELAVRAILGQQVSVTGARTLAARLVARCGSPLARAHGALTHAFPAAAELAAANLDGLGLTGARTRAIRALAEAVASASVVLDPCDDAGGVAATCAALVELPGIGPWTAAYIAMRALGDADAFPARDLGVRNAFVRAGLAADARAIETRAHGWRPWRAYAVLHLWMSLADPA